MYRFRMRAEFTVELEAVDAPEAYDILRSWLDAIEDGDGFYLQELTERYLARIRGNHGDCKNLYPVEDCRVAVVAET